MGRIFANAVEVLVWLGSDNTTAEFIELTTHMGFAPIIGIPQLREVNGVVKDVKPVYSSFSLHPHWNRARIT